jgi:HAD superfamily hydrolase (TIGR01549 family)
MKIKELIDRHEYISFDIFDTLIIRNINAPIDVFELVSNIYNIRYNNSLNDFKLNRVLAEKRVRTKINEEDVTLDEIYSELKDWYDEERLKILKKIEIECELAICTRHEEMIKWFDYAKSKNKHIIIASDMYLPREVIEKILVKSGIVGYKKLYISSHLRLTKYSGSMYKHIAEELGCKNCDILHIGDNIVSDIKRAASLGLNTFHVKGSGEGSISKKVKNKLRKNISTQDIVENIVNKFIDNKLKADKTNNNEYYRFGYKYFSLLIYGYLQWINEYCSTHNIEHLYFLSRDGYVLNKAYNEGFIAKKKINSSYLYVSRRALIPPSIDRSMDAEQIIYFLGIGRKDTVNSFFNRVGLKAEDYIEQIRSCGYEKDSLLHLDKKMNNFKKLFDITKGDIIETSERERINLLQYLQENKFFDFRNVGIVDVGWRGSLQYALNRLMKKSNYDINIHGFYLGLIRSSRKFIEEGLLAEGFVFSSDKNTQMEDSIYGCLGVIESLFFAPHGSVIKFIKNEDGAIETIFDEFEYTDGNEKLIELIQKGALDFVKDFSMFNATLEIKIKSELAVKGLLNVITKPNLKYAEALGDIVFSDFSLSHIAKPKPLKVYLKKPKTLLRDFSSSTWKIGFMKRLFKLHLPYTKIYELMKRTERKRY